MGRHCSQMTSPFKNNCLEGKVALISGGGSGIGLGIATHLGRHGAKVVIMGRREKFLEDAKRALTAEGCTAAYSAGDVREEADARAAVNKATSLFGRLDIVVNSAAGNFLA